MNLVLVAHKRGQFLAVVNTVMDFGFYKVREIAFFIYLFDQQSEYTAFHKLMCWQEASLWTF